MRQTVFDERSEKIERRRRALRLSTGATRRIQAPIADPYMTRGHPNPSGLGGRKINWWDVRHLFREARNIFHRSPLAQSSVLFMNTAAYRHAAAGRKAPYGGAEYAVPLSPDADAVSKKIAGLYGVHGAAICPSGLSAITTTFAAYSPQCILLPDNVYFPVERFLKEKFPQVAVITYPADASVESFAQSLAAAEKTAKYAVDKTMVYIEAPCSGTFEIPDLEGIAKTAKQKGIRTVMDNTWGSFVRCNPFIWGVDLVVEATTKYAGGYGDTPSGVIVAVKEEDHAKIMRELRVTGNGAVPAALCRQLNFRVDSAPSRMDRHFSTALQLMDWFSRQDFVAKVINPASEESRHRDRFIKYFGRGNGLFSVVFKEDISLSQIDAFNDALNFFHVGESWGGHVSLVLPVKTRHRLMDQPQGAIYRYHAGLEDPQDLLRDLDQAANKVFDTKPSRKPPVSLLGFRIPFLG